MGRAGVLQEIRRMRFEALLDRHERGELSQIEAAEMMGVSERTFRRWRDRLRDEGPEGLIDRRLGKPSSRRAAADEILRMLGLYRGHYADFTVEHFHEQLVKRHDRRLGYTVTKLHLHRAGLVKPAAAAVGAPQAAAAPAAAGHAAAPGTPSGRRCAGPVGRLAARLAGRRP